LKQGEAAQEAVAVTMAAWVLTVLQAQQAAALARSSSSQAGFSHCNSHLGFWQLVGLTHLLVQSNSSQTGEHLGSGASQVVWH